MLSHRNLVSNTVATVEYLGLKQTDSVLVILPFYYIYGNSLLLTHLMTGSRIVIDNRFAFPQVVLKTLSAERVTGLSGVPSNFMILLNNPGFVSAKLPALRYLTQAGGGMAPEIINRLRDAFADRDIYIMYGQTEASPRVTWLPPERLEEKLGSIGIEVPGVAVTIVGDDGQEAPVGGVGEMVVTGDNVMLGYWNHPDEEAEILREGRLFTGDLARRDEDGFFWVVSRRKEILKVGGNRVSAREVEERILELPQVLEVAVIGAADEVLGEAIRAVVALRDSQTLEAKIIRDHCRANLATHKTPKYVEFVAALPKLKTGKVDKQGLSRDFS